MNSISSRVRELFLNITDLPRAETLMDEIYVPDVVFEDPIQRIEGLAAFKKMNEGFATRLKELRFEVHGMVEGSDSLSVQWTMHFKLPLLSSPHTLPGVSWLDLGPEGKCLCHTDYWDFMRMSDEIAPVLRPMHDLIRKMLG